MGGSPQDINLAEFSKRTGLSGARARKLQWDDFIVEPHGNSGKTHELTALSSFTGVIDELLHKGVTNSSACFDRLQEKGYTGGATATKNHMREHADLILAKRKLAMGPQGNRGRRFQTDPGKAFQMGWGFVDAENRSGENHGFACSVMIHHHCGTCYAEVLPQRATGEPFHRDSTRIPADGNSQNRAHGQYKKRRDQARYE